MSPSAVDHPQHYGGADNPHEAIKVIEAWTTGWPAALGFHLGNAVKYLSRVGKKGDAIEDLEKARWYVGRAIESLGGPKNEPAVVTQSQFNALPEWCQRQVERQLKLPEERGQE